MRDKLIAAILSLLFPGLGHFYLGFLRRGLYIMGAFIVDIVLITLCSLVVGFGLFSQYNVHGLYPFAIALITLFGLLIPVIYFFSLFDALQLAGRRHVQDSIHENTLINERADEDVDMGDELLRSAFEGENRQERVTTSGSRLLGFILVVIGAILLVSFLIPYSLLRWVVAHFQTIFAILLLMSGGFLLWKQFRHRGGGF